MFIVPYILYLKDIMSKPFIYFGELCLMVTFSVHGFLLYIRFCRLLSNISAIDKGFPASAPGCPMLSGTLFHRRIPESEVHVLIPVY